MKKFKKLGALLLVFAVVTVFACGCGSGGGNTTESQSTAPTSSVQSTASAAPTEEDPYKDPQQLSIAIWGADSATSDIMAKDEIYQNMCKKFNITVTPVALNWNDYSQKIQVWATSGQLPDIFSIDAVGTLYYHNWISQGVVKALPSDLSQYPNLQKYLDTSDIDALKQDGSLYCIPRKSYPSLDYSAQDRLVFYRWDWAQAAGITREPDTWEDFKEMLKAIIAKDPEGKKTVGLTVNNVVQIGGFFWTYAAPAATSDGSGSDFKWIKEDGRYIPAVFSRGALESLKNMRDMYDQGLIDKNIATIKGDEANDKFVAGKAAALLISGGFRSLYGNIEINKWQKVNPDKKIIDCVRALKPLLNSNGDGNRYHCVFKTYWSESYFNAKIDDKKMDRIMRIYDYLVSDEGQDLKNYGIKDVDYKKDGEKYVVIDDQYLEGKKHMAFASIFKGLASWGNANEYDMNSPLITDAAERQYAVDWINWVKQNSKVPDFNPQLTMMSTSTKDKFSILDHNDMLKVMLSQETVEKAWGDIVNNYKTKGLDKMIDEVNAKAKEMGIN